MYVGCSDDVILSAVALTTLAVVSTHCCSYPEYSR